ncbi:MAG: anti-sigma factor [Polaromonas sp.]|nr:anti-sigma factor [Polaromonas sp.]
MNAAQHPELQTTRTGLTAVAPSGGCDVDRSDALSALVDGEIGAAQIDALLRAQGEQPDRLLATWHSYQVIGDVLRGSAPAAAVMPPPDFLAGVRERLRTEPKLPEPVSELAQLRAPAANDAVFRWKLLAGVASLAAVVAVSWSVLGGAPSAAGGGGPQLALQSPAPAPVLVTTERGTVVRDARLEELMAEHRQHGGMSALQMPAGFLRDATYDAAPKR